VPQVASGDDVVAVENVSGFVSKDCHADLSDAPPVKQLLIRLRTPTCGARAAAVLWSGAHRVCLCRPRCSHQYPNRPPQQHASILLEVSSGRIPARWGNKVGYPTV